MTIPERFGDVFSRFRPRAPRRLSLYIFLNRWIKTVTPVTHWVRIERSTVTFRPGAVAKISRIGGSFRRPVAIHSAS